MSEKLFICVMYVVMGLFLAAVAYPLMQKRIKPNGWYGFRLPKTMKNPDIWYAANAVLGKWLVIGGIITAVAAVILMIPPLTIAVYSIVILVISIGAITGGIVVAFRYLATL